MQWVVAFKGSRDAYQVPLALAEAGKLEALVTDWYSPFDRKWFARLTGILPLRIEAELRRRYRAGLPSKRVHTSPREFIRTKLSERSASDHGDNRIGTLAGQLARNRKAGLLSYSYYGHSAFNCAGVGYLPKVMFQVHPHPQSIRNLLLEEMELVPDGKASLSQEIELNMPDRRFAQLSEEPLLADFCIAASEYTKKTLVENGVDGNRVRVVPYGVDLDRFRPLAGVPEASQPFRVIFAGQMIQRKGLWYLLEAWKRLALPHAELILVGRGGMDQNLLAKYEGIFRSEVAVGGERLRELYATSDVCCVPSLIEGFGLVYLESLACGTPVIATPHTGAADLISEGEEGFIVDIRNVEALAERILWCYEHRPELSMMRPKARRLAERHTWSAFRGSIIDAVGEAEQVVS